MYTVDRVRKKDICDVVRAFVRLTSCSTLNASLENTDFTFYTPEFARLGELAIVITWHLTSHTMLRYLHPHPHGRL
jgi:hypothetical protein